MKDAFTIFRFMLFPIMCVIASFRYFFDDSNMINYVNIASCMIATTVVISIAQEKFEGECNESNAIKLLYFLNFLIFGALMLLEYRFKFIEPKLSDVFSIVALGLSLSSEMPAKLIRCTIRYLCQNQ